MEEHRERKPVIMMLEDEVVIITQNEETREDSLDRVMITRNRELDIQDDAFALSGVTLKDSLDGVSAGKEALKGSLDGVYRTQNPAYGEGNTGVITRIEGTHNSLNEHGMRDMTQNKAPVDKRDNLVTQIEAHDDSMDGIIITQNIESNENSMDSITSENDGSRGDSFNDNSNSSSWTDVPSGMLDETADTAFEKVIKSEKTYLDSETQFSKLLCLQCMTCGLKFKDEKPLKNHSEIHIVENLKQTKSQKKSLLAFKESAQVIYSSIFCCGYCTKRCESPNNLRYHVYMECTDCSLPVRERQVLSLLAKTDLTKLSNGQEMTFFYLFKVSKEKQTQSYECNKCHVKFSQHSAILEHLAKTCHDGQGLGVQKTASTSGIQKADSGQGMTEVDSGSGSHVTSFQAVLPPVGREIDTGGSCETVLLQKVPLEPTERGTAFTRNSDGIRSGGTRYIWQNGRLIVQNPPTIDQSSISVSDPNSETPRFMQGNGFKQNECMALDQRSIKTLASQTGKLVKGSDKKSSKSTGIGANNRVYTKSQTPAFRGFFSCEICFKRYTTMKSLKRHEKLFHGVGLKSVFNINEGGMLQKGTRSTESTQMGREQDQLSVSENEFTQDPETRNKRSQSENGQQISSKNPKFNEHNYAKPLPKNSDENTAGRSDADLSPQQMVMCVNPFSDETGHVFIMEDMAMQTEHLCCICGEMFENKRSLDSHKWEVHRRLFCNCVKESWSGKTDETTGEKMCDVCGKFILHPDDSNKKQLQKISVADDRKEDLNSSEHDSSSVVDDPEYNMIDEIVENETDSRRNKPVHKTITSARQKNNFLCNICGKHFTQEKSLKRHKQWFHREENGSEHPKNFSCDICNKRFLQKSSVKWHKQMFHSGVISEGNLTDDGDCDVMKEPSNGYRCEICDKIFSQKRSLKRHKEKFHSYKIFIETEAGEEQQIDFEDDEADPSADPSADHEDFRCDICNKSFAQKTSVRRHKQRFHSGKFPLRPEFKQPNNEVAPPTEEPVWIKQEAVDDCEAEDIKPDISHDPDSQVTMVQDNFTCDICGEVFLHETTVLLHKKELHKIQKDQDESSRNYQSSVAVSRLMCDICHRIFSSPTNVRRHKLSVHARTNRTFYKPSSSSRMANISKHRYFAQKKKVLADELMCDICRKVFSEVRHVRRHKLVVHGQGLRVNVKTKGLFVRPRTEPSGTDGETLWTDSQKMNETVCDICNKTFSGLINMKRHRTQAHPKADPIGNRSSRERKSVDGLMCDICNKIFSEARHVKRHKLTVHRQGLCVNLKAKGFFVPTGTEQTGTDGETLSTNSQKMNEPTGLMNESVCDICNKTFSGLINMKRHRTQAHPKADPIRKRSTERSLDDLKCDICNKIFSEVSHVKRHKITVHRQGLFVNLKAKGFFVPTGTEQTGTDGETLSTDSQQMNEPTGLMNESVCDICNKTFSGLINMKRHRTQAHPKADPLRKRSTERSLDDLKCDICNKIFSEVSHVKRHKITVHRQGLGVDVKAKSLFLGHGTEQTGTDGETLSTDSQKMNEPTGLMNESVCDICSKTFSGLINMKRHRTQAHPKADPIGKRSAEISRDDLKCDICNKIFSEARHVKRHKLSVHARDSQEQSDVERKENNTKLSSRSEEQGESAGSREWTCNIFKKKFSGMECMDRHKATVHAKEKYLDIESSESCEENSIHSTRTEPLKKPMCRICNKIFSCPSTLYRHLRNVHGEVRHEFDGKSEDVSGEESGEDSVESSRDSNGMMEPKELMKNVKCDICNKSFSHQKCVRKHKLTVHGHDNFSTYIINHSFKLPQKFMCVVKCEKLLVQGSTVSDTQRQLFHGDKRPRWLRDELVSQEADQSQRSNDFRCDICNKLFKLKKSISWHKKQFHTQELKKHAAKDSNCEVKCLRLPGNLKFQAKKLLARAKHAKRYHWSKQFLQNTHGLKLSLSSINVFTCDICDQQYTNKKSLYRHRKRFHFEEMNRQAKNAKSSQHGRSFDVNVHKHSFRNTCRCEFCHKLFCSPGNANRHKRNVHKRELRDRARHEKNHFSKIGAVSKMNSSSYTLDQSADSGNDLMCDICNKTFSETRHVKRHKLTVHVRDRLKLSDEKYKKDNAHLNSSSGTLTHSTKSWNELMCDICKKTFSNVGNVNRHKLTVHARGRELVSESEEDHEDNSMESSRRETLKEHLCEICNKLFSTSSNLFRHQRNVHAEDKPEYDSSKMTPQNDSGKDTMCNICNKVFSCPRNVRRHRETVHSRVHDDHHNITHGLCFEKENESTGSVDEPTYDISTKTFPQPSSVRRHKKIVYASCDDEESDSGSEEEEERNSSTSKCHAKVCDICNKKFSYGWCVARHKRTVHASGSQGDTNSERGTGQTETVEKNSSPKQKEPVNDLTCDVCYKVFTYSKSVKRHKRTIHAQRSNKSDNENDGQEMEMTGGSSASSQKEIANNLTCDICNKVFTYAWNAKRHKKTMHARDEDESNSDSAEPEKESLTSEQKETVSDFMCDICNKMFTYVHNMKRHKLRVHGEPREVQRDLVGEEQMSTEIPINRGVVDKRVAVRLFQEFVCDICDQVFVHQSSIKRHKQKFHAEQEIASTDKHNQSCDQMEREGKTECKNPDSETVVRGEYQDSESLSENCERDNTIQTRDKGKHNNTQLEDQENEVMELTEYIGRESQAQCTYLESENLESGNSINENHGYVNRIQSENLDRENCSKSEKMNNSSKENADSENIIQNQHSDTEEVDITDSVNKAQIENIDKGSRIRSGHSNSANMTETDHFVSDNQTRMGHSADSDSEMIIKTEPIDHVDSDNPSG